MHGMTSTRWASTLAAAAVLIVACLVSSSASVAAPTGRLAAFSAPGSGTLQLTLPWATGADGTVFQGCHSWAGANGNGACSSFDVLPSGGRVLSPMDGVVRRDGSCAPAEVRIQETSGWSISFYHL